jgi:hypothetical protein
LAYYAWLFAVHPVYRWWGIQNNMGPPQMGSFILTLGFLSVLFAFSLDKLGGFQRKPAPLVLLGSCFLSGFLIVFAANPIIRSSGQLRCPFVVPAALLATVDLELAILALTKRKTWAIPALIAFLVVNSMTSIFLYARTVYAVTHDREAIPGLGENRIKTKLLEAYRWLDSNSRPREVVLASVSNCNRIPHYTRNATFAGYGFNTVDYDSKRRMVEHFFNEDTSDSFRRDLLRYFRVRFLLWSPEEMALGGYRPDSSSLFIQRFAKDGVIVYEVNHAFDDDGK